jgi:hypothetical protein
LGLDLRKEFVNPLTFTPPKLFSSSHYLTVIAVQRASEPLMALDRCPARIIRHVFHNQPIARPLVIALVMMNFYKPIDCLGKESPLNRIILSR